jgi:hypothetical protein
MSVLHAVDDHVLDVMAFMRQIRIIKAVEGPQRRAMQAEAASKAAASAEARVQRKQHRNSRRSSDSRSSTATVSRNTTEDDTAVAAPVPPALRSNSEINPADGISTKSALAEAQYDRTAVLDGTPREESTDLVDIGDAVATPTASAQNLPIDPEAVIQQNVLASAARSGTSSIGTRKDAIAVASTGSIPSAIKAKVPASAATEQQRSRGPQQRSIEMIDATSRDANDVKIVCVGHSMGGCVLLLYALFSKALRRPHWLSRLVLLSPAGLHIALASVPNIMLRAMKAVYQFDGNRPFPMRSYPLQRIAARVLQDFKRLQSTNDFMSEESF